MWLRKANGQWKVYLDVTDLNKAYSKDNFPLPWIDQLIDVTSIHKLLSFMDAYSGYNQFRMYQPNQDKPTFMRDRGLYYYKVMLFGLKNVGTTY